MNDDEKRMKKLENDIIKGEKEYGKLYAEWEKTESTELLALIKVVKQDLIAKEAQLDKLRDEKKERKLKEDAEAAAKRENEKDKRGFDKEKLKYFFRSQERSNFQMVPQVSSVPIPTHSGISSSTSLDTFPSLHLSYATSLISSQAEDANCNELRKRKKASKLICI